LFQRASSSPATSRLCRIGGVVLPEGTIGGIARRFEIALECFAHLIPPLVGFFSAATAAAMAPGRPR